MDNRNFCASCGNPLIPGAVACTNCGSPILGAAAQAPTVPQVPQYGQVPPQYGQPAAPYGQVPPQYGQPTAPYGQMPPQYGQPTAPYGQMPPQYGQFAPKLKSKTTAVLLAVFLGFWGWLYTYKRDAAKFWISAAASVVLIIVGVGVFVNWIFWVWAVIDAAVRTNDWYNKYPNGN